MLLQVSNLTKSYGASNVLSQISLQVQEFERIGLVGVNGAGKSTLLQIIAGEMSCDSGDVFKSKETRIGYVKQNNPLLSDHTIWKEMLSVFSELLLIEQELRDLERMISAFHDSDHNKSFEPLLNRYATKSEWFKEHGGYEVETKIRSILHGLGFGQIAPDTLVNTLSGGQKTRLALAKMLLEEPNLLMLDEPTNHLDIPTLTWLETYLRNYPGAILVVSHDRYFLDAVVTAIYEIERHTSKRYTGNYSKFIQTKSIQYDQLMKQYEKQQVDIHRMEDFVQRNIARASTTKRAQSRRKALVKMDRIDKPFGDLKRASFSFEIERNSGKDVLVVDQLTLSYPDRQALIQNANFRLQRGDAVALIGPNGVGKTTLLKTLIGKHTQDSGHFQWGVHVNIAFYEQEQNNMNEMNTVLDEVWDDFLHVEEVAIRQVLAGFLFSGEAVLKKISSLSGGERARVALAKLMLQQANVLILDEPTNHLDLYSKEMLEAALMSYEGTLLFISHDRYFLNKLADHMLEMTSEGITTYLGNYDDYVEKKLEIAEMKAMQVTGNTGNHSVPLEVPTDYHLEKHAKREERSRIRKLEQLELHISQLETELAQFEADLENPTIYQDYALVQQIAEYIQKTKDKLQSCYQEWEGLADTP